MQIKILLKKVTIPMGKLMKIMLAEEKNVYKATGLFGHTNLFCLFILPYIYRNIIFVLFRIESYIRYIYFFFKSTIKGIIAVM